MQTDASWHIRPLDCAVVLDSFAGQLKLTDTTLTWPVTGAGTWTQLTGGPANTYWHTTTTRPRGKRGLRAQTRVTALGATPRATPSVTSEAEASTRVTGSEPDTSARPT